MNKIVRIGKRLCRNLRFLLQEDLYTQNQVNYANKPFRQASLFAQMLSLAEQDPSYAYSAELDCLKEIGHLDVFPYRQLKTLPSVETGFDYKELLPYVVHEGKRLYLPLGYSAQSARNLYKNLIERESILGEGYIEKSPHCYTTVDFDVKTGDVLLDIGAAEALFTLDKIDRAEKAYVFEPEAKWQAALHATFKPYGDKVVIIQKFVSDENSDIAVTLSSVFGAIPPSKLFVKMDVEGYEQCILNSSMDLLLKASDLRIACCTYHRHNDARDIQALFRQVGLSYEFSDGVMLFLYDPLLRSPFFRKGMIRGWKNTYAV